MKKIIKNLPFLYLALLRAKHRLWSKKTEKVLKNYLADHQTRKLQLGAGLNNLPGWFNTDYFPRRNIFFVDVTKPFPIPSNSFDFIYSEHHIEHISYKHATEMLKEISRILKPGGFIKISTPDLQKYVKSYGDDSTLKAETAQHARDWIYSGFYNAVNYVPVDDYFQAHFVNDIFLNYAHHFIYDFMSLKRILENAGFSNVVNCDPKESVHSEFNNIETHITDFDRHFTLYVEAQKPLNE